MLQYVHRNPEKTYTLRVRIYVYEAALSRISSFVYTSPSHALPRINLEPMADAEGAAFYTAKEVGFCNDDAVGWNIASIPAVLHRKRPVRPTAHTQDQITARQ